MYEAIDNDDDVDDDDDDRHWLNTEKSKFLLTDSSTFKQGFNILITDVVNQLITELSYDSSTLLKYLKTFTVEATSATAPEP